MPSFPWKDLLAQWSVEIIRSGEYEDELTPEVAGSGWLGYPGATQDEIAAAETRLGVTFPPSYREFLQVSNGWRMTTGVHRAAAAGKRSTVFFRGVSWTLLMPGWKLGSMTLCPMRSTSSTETGPSSPCGPSTSRLLWLVSDYGDGIFLLNPQTVTPEGEWEAWFFAHWVPGADRYPSFWELMAAEHEHFLYALKSDRGEPTPRADPSLGVDAEDLDGLVAASPKPREPPGCASGIG